MCVEIVKSDKKVSYKMDLPLEDQIKGSKEVIIDCGPECEKVTKFLDEIERLCNIGKPLGISVKMVNLTNLNLFRKTKKFNKELLVNDIISGLVQLHKKADDALEEISKICKKG